MMSTSTPRGVVRTARRDWRRRDTWVFFSFDPYWHPPPQTHPSSSEQKNLSDMDISKTPKSDDERAGHETNMHTVSVRLIVLASCQDQCSRPSLYPPDPHSTSCNSAVDIIPCQIVVSFYWRLDSAPLGGEFPLHLYLAKKSLIPLPPWDYHHGDNPSPTPRTLPVIQESGEEAPSQLRLRTVRPRGEGKK